MSSSSKAGGGPIRRRSGRHATKGSGTYSAAADELHGPLHEMHRAIERSTTSFKDMQKLLDKGETFCRGDGLNCFILQAVCKGSKDPSKRWDFLLKMLQVDSRGILARDKDGKTLLNYFNKDVDKMKKLIELGANLNGKDLIQSVFSSETLASFPSLKDQDFVQFWDILLAHKNVQNHVINSDFLEELVQLTKKSSLARKMFCNLIQKGILSVEQLTEKLKMHPMFFIIELRCEESLKLLLYIFNDDPYRRKNVDDLGVDLNVVDKTGKSLVECLFDLLAYSYKSYKSHTERLTLKLWNLLVKRGEIQSQASKDGFIRSLAPFAKGSPLFRAIFASIFQLGIWSVEKLTSELQMHPIFFLMELEEGKLHKYLQVIHRYPQFLKDKTITFTKKIVDSPPRGLTWQKVQSVLNTSDVLTVDIFGYILLTFKLSSSGDEDEKALFQCLTTLLACGFVPSSEAGVVHPIHALLYNILINSTKNIDKEKKFPIILLQTLANFKDFPIPHKLVLAGADRVLRIQYVRLVIFRRASHHSLTSPVVHQEMPLRANQEPYRTPEMGPEINTLMLDIHLLMSSMMNPIVMENFKANETLFALIMALMQLSPLHPLQHFTIFYKYSSCYFSFERKILFLETFCKLLRLTLEASGKHKFQGVDQPTIKCINHFCESVQEFRESPFEAEEIRLHREAAVKAKSEMGSLQWLSILQIRKTLFLSRSSTTLTLPSLISGLVTEGHLPQGLEADVLVYKPKKFVLINKGRGGCY